MIRTDMVAKAISNARRAFGKKWECISQSREREKRIASEKFFSLLANARNTNKSSHDRGCVRVDSLGARMSEIKVGDLVMVVRAHCTEQIGKIATVTEISGGKWTCLCGEVKSEELTARLPNIALRQNFHMSGWYPLSWLRKIEPLSEPETTETREEIEA